MVRNGWSDHPVDGQKERTVLEECDFHLKKKIGIQSANKGAGCLSLVDSMQTLPGPGDTWMGSSGAG